MEISCRKGPFGLGFTFYTFLIGNLWYKVCKRTLRPMPVIRKDYLNIGIDFLFWHFHILWCGRGIV